MNASAEENKHATGIISINDSYSAIVEIKSNILFFMVISWLCINISRINSNTIPRASLRRSWFSIYQAWCAGRVSARFACMGKSIICANILTVGSTTPGSRGVEIEVAPEKSSTPFQWQRARWQSKHGWVAIHIQKSWLISSCAQFWPTRYHQRYVPLRRFH